MPQFFKYAMFNFYVINIQVITFVVLKGFTIVMLFRVKLGLKDG